MSRCKLNVIFTSQYSCTLVLPVIQLFTHIYWALTRNAEQYLKVKWIELSLLMSM